MRTTITIDDEILKQLKARAASEGTTVSRVIENLVRGAAQPTAIAAESRFQLVTFGKGGRFTSLDADRIAASQEHKDLVRYVRRK
ncbi:MAG TPA: ribbon-helix-helix protein, CopG family [Thermoanaerobaculia bacterium]|nr:ribbon-helix-helix protein, CopG family [Thermoanaerobaculia bacterium]